MNNIKITLLTNKKFEVENLDDIDILEDEDNATNIEIQFPEEYSEHSKRIDFMNIRGEKWSTSLYAPEEPTNEYAEGFDTLNFMFSIPNAMAKRGELQIQPIAYIPGQSVVPFRILVAKIDKSIIYATTPGKETPDLVIKAYEHSNKALSTANEAFAKIEHSEELVEIATQNSTNSTNKANEAQASALAAQNSATSAQNSATASQKSAESSQLSAKNAENSANAAKESAKTAENLASTANNKSTTAVNTANESNEKSTKALEIVDNLTVSSEEIDCEETTKIEIQTNSSSKRKNIHFSVPAPKKGTSYRNKGVWSSTNNYVNDQYFIDTVSLHGCTYYCKVSNANQQPLPSEENEYWGLIAIKGSDAGVTIEDNLNSTYADHVLSARQGKVLKELIASSVETAITNLVNNAPSNLNTLNKLALAIENDPQFATTIKNLIQTNATNIAGNSTEITKIKNGSTIVPKSHAVVEADTRSVNSTPADYMAQGYNGVRYEFKQNSVIGLTASGTGTYSDIMVCVPWQDSSGGYPLQIAFNSGGLYYRVGTSNTTWGAWYKITNQTELQSNVNTLNNAIATKEGLSVYSASFVAKTTTTGTVIVHKTNNKMLAECYFNINLSNAINQNSNTDCSITISGLDSSAYSSASMLSAILTQNSAAVTNDYMNSHCAQSGTVTRGTTTTIKVNLRRAYSEQNVWCWLYIPVIFQ